MFYDDERRKIVDNLNKQTISQRVVEASKQIVERGEAYLSLVNSRGWELLLEEFIAPRLSMERFINANPNDLPFIQREMRLLIELLNFVENSIRQAKLEANLMEKLYKIEKKKLF